jgi:1H-pyrrole-2-carbonyl-[peptidyl-carrier protein] brominase
MNKNVVIVGGGPGGAACAIELKKSGISPIIVEKEKFPRFHIGESMTGECGASVRKLGPDLESRMRAAGHPIKWGTMVWGKGGKSSFYVPVMGRMEGGELFEQSTWQVRRGTFDKMLFDYVVEMGIETVVGTATGVIREAGEIKGIKVNTGESEIEIAADLIVDASGQNTFLRKQGITGQREPGKYGKQIGIFGHFKNATRDEGKERRRDDTLIFYREQNHWAWFIPLDDEIVSIGVVVPSDYFRDKHESREEFLLREMHLINPELEWRLKDAELVDDVRAMSNYSYQIKDFTGKGFICLGDAHRFIDPIFSFGLHFALHEGRHAAHQISSYFESPVEGDENPFRDYARYCEDAMDIIQTMVDSFWDYPLAFSLYMNSNKYRDGFVDIFAGRVYNANDSEGVRALRKLNMEGDRLKQARSKLAV